MNEVSNQFYANIYLNNIEIWFVELIILKYQAIVGQGIAPVENHR